MSNRTLDKASDLMRSMPYSDDAEKGVLSCFLQNPVALLNDAQVNLPVEMFYGAANRLIYQVLLEFNQALRPVDLVTLSNYFLDKKLMDKIGGPAVLAEIYSFVPTTAHYAYYVSIVREKFILRQGIGICTDAIEESYQLVHDEGQQWTASLVEKTLRLHEQTMGGKSSGRSYRELLVEVVTNAGAGPRGDTLGLPWVDRITGGAQPKKVFVIAGGISDGKSALAIQMCGSLAENGHPGAIYSLEMPGEEVMQRVICQQANIRSGVWTNGSLNADEMAKFKAFTRRADLPVVVHDDLEAIEEIAASIRIEKGRRNIKWALIDYAQLCTAKRDKSDNREREMAIISRTTKRVAMTLDITIFLLSQLNDDGKLRESRAIGADADKVLILSTTKNEDERVLRIAKNRGGPRNKKILMSFEGEYFRFREKEEQK